MRERDFIPAELYGHGFENIHLSVPAKNFSRVFKEAGASAIIKLVLSGAEGLKDKNEFNVLINNFQRSPLTNEISHIDFYSVRMDEKITAAIPLEFINESPAVKEKIGILIKAMHEIEIEALPADLPHHIEVDISNLSNIGMNIRVKDLKINKGVKLLVDRETVVAVINEIAKEEEIVAPISVEEVKVEGEEKKKKKKRKRRKMRTQLLIDINLPAGRHGRRNSARLNLSFNPWIAIPFKNLLRAIFILPVVLFFVFGSVTAPTSGGARAAQNEEERKALEVQLADLENQISKYETTIGQYKKQGTGLQSEIKRLESQITKLNLQIKAVNLTLSKLDSEISNTQGQISQTESDIVSSKKIFPNCFKFYMKTTISLWSKFFLKIPSFRIFSAI